MAVVGIAAVGESMRDSVVSSASKRWKLCKCRPAVPLSLNPRPTRPLPQACSYHTPATTYHRGLGHYDRHTAHKTAHSEFRCGNATHRPTEQPSRHHPTHNPPPHTHKCEPTATMLTAARGCWSPPPLPAASRSPAAFLLLQRRCRCLLLLLPPLAGGACPPAAAAAAPAHPPPRRWEAPRHCSSLWALLA